MPLVGAFRFHDIFQIYPSNLDGQPVSRWQEHFPAILEFWTDEQDAIELDEDRTEIEEIFPVSRMIVKQNMILDLLSAFSNHLFFSYQDYDGRWGVVLPEEIPPPKGHPDRDKTEFETTWSVPMFHWKGLPPQLEITEFTQVDAEAIKTRKHFQYFLHDPNVDDDSKHPITFPSTIHFALNAYFAKTTQVRETIDTAISYIVTAVELKRRRKTLSMLSAFTALETLVNLEYEDYLPVKCATCGQPEYKISKRYRDFLLKYIGDSPSNKRSFNRLYSHRSKIVHTGRKLRIEHLFRKIQKATGTKNTLRTTRLYSSLNLH